MIETKNINKVFKRGKKQVAALVDLSLEIHEQSFSIIKGPSGCGKSTLLFTLGGLLSPTSGSVQLLRKDLYQLNEYRRRVYTAKNLGFVFQAYHLIPYLTVHENILVQKKLSYIDLDLAYIEKLLTDLKLTDRLSHKPEELSAGEKQRVALVRALASNPKIILADEPTGNLDPENSEIVLSFLQSYQKQGGTIVMVSHSSDADDLADRIIHIKNGKIVLN